MCATCLEAENKNVDAKPHKCPKNYSGSSKAMEADAALEAYEDLYEMSEGTVVIGCIVADDDSSMKSFLKHQSPSHPKGHLPERLPEPIFLADPTHRTRVIAKYFYALAALSNSESECTKVDALRIKRWFGYMLKMYRETDMDTLKKAVASVLEHLFDDHRFCDPKWRKPLRLQQQTRNENLPETDLAGPRGRDVRPPTHARPLPPARSSQTSSESYELPHPAEKEITKQTKGYYRNIKWRILNCTCN